MQSQHMAGKSKNPAGEIIHKMPDHICRFVACSEPRVEEACLLVYESLNLGRAFLRHFSLAQLTTPPSVLGHNLPQHHSKAVDINLHHNWQAGRPV